MCNLIEFCLAIDWPARSTTLKHSEKKGYAKKNLT